MNRRNFLKRCSILPFVGSLSAVAKTGVSVVRSGTRPATKEEVDEFDLFTGYRTKKPSLHCEICYEDCPLFLQCHGVDKGLDEAFCYGGKLFRVYDRDGVKVLILRIRPWETHTMLDRGQYENYEFRLRVCEKMIKFLENKQV